MYCEKCEPEFKTPKGRWKKIKPGGTCKVCCNQIYTTIEEGNVLCPACSLIYHRCEHCGEILSVPTVLISIKPKWWNLIKTGKKTVEIRKTAPKKFKQFNVLCYVSQPVGAIMGSFLCDSVERTMDPDSLDPSKHKVPTDLLHEYITDGKPCYGWHITDLHAFPVPLYLSDIGETKAPMSWCFLDRSISDESIHPVVPVVSESETYEDLFYHPIGRIGKQGMRSDELASIPLPYKDKKMDDDERKYGWNILPTELIPLLRDDMTLSDNRMRLMCDADQEHAYFDVGHWATDPYDVQNNISLALISSCIKDDYNQTLGQLALRVAFLRRLPFLEVARHLTELCKQNKLGYFKKGLEGEHYYTRWHPSTECSEQVLKGLTNDWQSSLFGYQSR